MFYNNKHLIELNATTFYKVKKRSKQFIRQMLYFVTTKNSNFRIGMRPKSVQEKATKMLGYY